MVFHIYLLYSGIVPPYCHVVGALHILQMEELDCELFTVFFFFLKDKEIQKKDELKIQQTNKKYV